MKILKIQALRGPNLWSIQRKKLIQMRLDLEDMEEKPTNKIPGFRERIEAMFPSMIEHRCSEGCRGGYSRTGDVLFAQGQGNHSRHAAEILRVSSLRRSP